MRIAKLVEGELKEDLSLEAQFLLVCRFALLKDKFENHEFALKLSIMYSSGVWTFFCRREGETPPFDKKMSKLHLGRSPRRV
jgi:hypothetical protein